MTRWLSLILLLACSGKSEPPGADTHDPATTPDNPTNTATSTMDPATVALDGACALADDHGGFVVLSSEDGAGVQGSVADGVVPSSVLEEIGSEGDCRLLRRNNPFCDPECAAGEVCDFDGSCLPYPANQDLGIVTIESESLTVVMEPVFPGNTYYDTTLSNPPFSSGELVTLEMPDGVYGPLELHGVGIEPLETTDEEWQVSAGAELAVHWTPPEGSLVRSQVALMINVDQHGATPGVLQCSFADTGEGWVPAGIIDSLINSGVTGFPSGSLNRHTVDRAQLAAGCLDFEISAPLSIDVDVLGYTPCFSDADCPKGQTCNVKLQICE